MGVTCSDLEFRKTTLVALGAQYQWHGEAEPIVIIMRTWT